MNDILKHVGSFAAGAACGGVLLSISMLFGGLALTAMTLKKESDYDE